MTVCACGTELHQGRVRLDVSKRFFTSTRVVRHWDRLHRAVVVAPAARVWTVLSDIRFDVWMESGVGLSGPCGCLPTWDIL